MKSCPVFAGDRWGQTVIGYWGGLPVRCCPFHYNAVVLKWEEGLCYFFHKIMPPVFDKFLVCRAMFWYTSWKGSVSRLLGQAKAAW